LTRFVIDASTALYLASADRGVPSGHELHAPSLMHSEAMSALHEASWRGDVAPEIALGHRDRLLQLPVTVHGDEGNLIEAWSLTDRFGWAKTYDAQYVALAHSLGCALLTLDARLVRGVRGLIATASFDALT
jgi:predicted nucleic acid-binding protein